MHGVYMTQCEALVFLFLLVSLSALQGSQLKAQTGKKLPFPPLVHVVV